MEMPCNNTRGEGIGTKLQLVLIESIKWATKLELVPMESRKGASCGKTIEWRHQFSVELCVSNQDNPKTIGCWGDAMRKNVRTSWWDPTWSTNGTVTFVTTPEDRTILSMNSTSIGCDVWMMGTLCAWTNTMSIKQVDAPESSNAWDCIEIDP